MVRVTNEGISGTIDQLVYYTMNGKRYVRIHPQICTTEYKIEYINIIIPATDIVLDTKGEPGYIAIVVAAVEFNVSCRLPSLLWAGFCRKIIFYAVFN